MNELSVLYEHSNDNIMKLLPVYNMYNTTPSITDDNIYSTPTATTSNMNMNNMYSTNTNTLYDNSNSIYSNSIYNNTLSIWTSALANLTALIEQSGLSALKTNTYKTTTDNIYTTSPLPTTTNNNNNNNNKPKLFSAKFPLNSGLSWAKNQAARNPNNNAISQTFPTATGASASSRIGNRGSIGGSDSITASAAVSGVGRLALVSSSISSNSKNVKRSYSKPTPHLLQGKNT